jgi:hypothetical protein
MQEGKIVPNEITCGLLRREMENYKDKVKLLI